MLDIEEFSQVVSQVHTAAGRPDRWARAFADITRWLDATACTLVSGSGSRRSLLATTISAEAALTYENYYHQVDFIVDALQSGPVGEVRSGWEIVVDNSRSEFYHDWQRRFEMTDGLLVRLAGPEMTGFVVSAAPRDEPYASAERVRSVNALLPHLQHAVQTQSFFTTAELGPGDLTALDDVIRHGVVVVTRAGRIVSMNAAAERVVRLDDGLRTRGNVITASLASNDAVLQDRIAKAVGAEADRSRIGGYVACGRPSGKRPYVLRLVPLDDGDGPPAARAAIVIADPERDVKPSKALLRELFGLTAAEAEVALRMLRCDGLAAIADDFAVSIGTVKTHVHRVFHKTGTHRQGELIRLLSGLGV